MAKIIDGKAAAARLRGQVALDAARFAEQAGRKPGLAVVLVGDDPASSVYVRNKGKAAREAGVESFEFKRDADLNEADLLALVASLNADPRVDGILVQLPLPAHISEAAILAAIDPAKDVDGFHVVNAGKLATGAPGLVPCTPLGCLMLLQDELEDLSGLDALVIGRSNIVGKPMAALLLAQNCTVTIAHSRTKNLQEKARAADILVAAIGKPQFVRGDWIKPGAIVIDVGINRIVDADNNPRLVGDVAMHETEHARAVTPVPGGVGPMTIAVLLRNTLAAARARTNLA